jgi:hypothetical protein
MNSHEPIQLWHRNINDKEDREGGTKSHQIISPERDTKLNTAPNIIGFEAVLRIGLKRIAPQPVSLEHVSKWLWAHDSSYSNTRTHSLDPWMGGRGVV